MGTSGVLESGAGLGLYFDVGVNRGGFARSRKSKCMSAEELDAYLVELRANPPRFRGPHPNLERRAEVLRLRQERLPFWKIGELMGISEQSAHALAKKAGVPKIGLGYAANLQAVGPIITKLRDLDLTWREVADSLGVRRAYACRLYSDYLSSRQDRPGECGDLPVACEGQHDDTRTGADPIAALEGRDALAVRLLARDEGPHVGMDLPE